MESGVLFIAYIISKNETTVYASTIERLRFKKVREEYGNKESGPILTLCDRVAADTTSILLPNFSKILEACFE